MALSGKPTFAQNFANLKEKFSHLNGDELLYALILEIASLRSAVQLVEDRIFIAEEFVKSKEGSFNDEFDAIDDWKLPTEIKIDANWKLGSDRAFYQLEYTDDGLPFRWSGPSNLIGFNILVDRKTEKRATITLIAIRDVRNFETIGCMVDGEPVELERREDNRIFYLTAVLPSRPRKGPTHVLFNIPIMSVADEGKDNRIIGVAFRNLTVV